MGSSHQLDVQPQEAYRGETGLKSKSYYLRPELACEEYPLDLSECREGRGGCWGRLLSTPAIWSSFPLTSC
jgi:hypothetical protein